MPRSIFAFALATLFPLPFLGIGMIFGGWPIWAALIYITVFVAAVDLVFPASDAGQNDASDGAADVLSLILASAHFLVLIGVIWSLSGKGVGLFSLDGVALFIASGWFFGQVSNSNAHELIHRGSLGLRQVGRWIYISLLFGHHASAHTSVHHTHVATPNDPNTSRMDESFWRFYKRAWLGSFQAGLAVEQDRLTRKGKSRWDRRNPYVTYISGAILVLFFSFLIAGYKGILIHLLVASFAQLQLMLSDYVQHYGLQRRLLENGSYEPIAAQHSWNAPHWLSGLWMLNAPRHSDHHTHPAKPFVALTNPAKGDAPVLPYSIPVMACIALFPSVWRKVMNPRVQMWREA